MAPNNTFWSTLRSPKLPPPDNPTPFQQRLLRNPYAVALASPVRSCAITRTALPRAFLQTFEALPRPDTDEHWLLPRDLSTPVPRDELADEETNKHSHIGSRHYMLASKELLEVINTKMSGLTGSWNKLAGQTLKNSSRKRYKWRGDMDEFVCGLMRKRIEDELMALMGMKQGFLKYATGWDDVVRHKQMGAVLWLGPFEKKRRTKFPEWWVHKAQEDDPTKMTGKGSPLTDENGPGLLATISNPPFWEKKLPLHNLVMLLGQEGVDSLRERAKGNLSHELASLKDKKETVHVRMMLWKLQGFLARSDGEYSI